MANRRTRSVDRLGPQEEILGQLVHELRGLRTNQPVERREQFKAPQFNGEGDVELFIRHFTQVAEANEWTPVAALLHLRESLKDAAQECARHDTIEAIITGLRGRFRLSTREARSRLSNLKRDLRSSLHEHAALVEKLVRKAYQDMPEQLQATMMLDTFCSTIGNASLQRHLLAIHPNTMMEAVQHGKEFLQVKADRPHAESNIRNMDDSCEQERVAATEQDPIAMLTKTIEQLAAKVESLQKGVVHQEKTKKCWGCQKTGHICKECPTHPWQNQKSQTWSGNGGSPQ